MTFGRFFSLTFWFSEVLEGPRCCQNVREAHRTQFPQFLSKADFMVPSDVQKTNQTIVKGFPLELIGNSLLNSPFKRGLGGFFELTRKNYNEY